MSAWGDFFNPDVREKDVKLLAFGLVVLLGMGKLLFTPLSLLWVQAFCALGALVGLGGPAFMAIDRWGGGSSTGGRLPRLSDEGDLQ